MEEKIIICADVIAKYKGKIVLVQRFTKPPGFALPGGKLDPGEFLSDTIKREFLEETGLVLEVDDVLSMFAKKDRDPRGRYISTVFIGHAIGKPKDEPNKTEVIFATIEELPRIKDKFIFDHWEILENYLDLLKAKGGSDGK